MTSKGVKRRVSPAQHAESRKEGEEDYESDLEARDLLDDFTEDKDHELYTRLVHAEDSSDSDESESKEPAVAMASTCGSASDSDSSSEDLSSPTERRSPLPSSRHWASTSGISHRAIKKAWSDSSRKWSNSRSTTGQCCGRVGYSPQPTMSLHE